MQDAVVIAIRHMDRFLIIRRAAGTSMAGYWAPVSGRVEAGESLPDAARREAREEMGAEIRVTGKVWECRSHDGRYLLHWIAADLTGGGQTPAAAEVAEYRWLSAAEFCQLEPAFDDDRHFFNHILPRLNWL